MDITAIKKRIEQIDNFEHENKVAREAIKNELENDPIFLEAIEDVREANIKRNRIKNEILAKEEIQKLQANIKENNEEVAALKEILSTELMEVYTKANTDIIEDNFGEPRKFKIVAKLMPRKKKDDQGRDHIGRYEKEPMAMVEPIVSVSQPTDIVSDESIDDATAEGEAI